MRLFGVILNVGLIRWAGEDASELNLDEFENLILIYALIWSHPGVG